jgi:copper chaperone CopZ
MINKIELYGNILFLAFMLLGFQGAAQGLDTHSLKVYGACGMCEERIESTALNTMGVIEASWEADSKLLTVSTDRGTFDEISLHLSITAAGHDTDEFKADDNVYETLPECCQYRPESQEQPDFTSVVNSENSISITVFGACGMCQDRIEENALKVGGVEAASWDVDTRKLAVIIDPVIFDLDLLHQKIADVGHDTDLILADDDVYSALPGCCLYRSSDNPHYIESEKSNQNTSRLSNKIRRIQGSVYEEDGGTLSPLMGANLYWLGSTRGTTTDLDGKFRLARESEQDQLIVISYVGYDNDTLQINSRKMDIVLSNTINLQTVEIRHKRKSTEISTIGAIKTQRIGEKELLKAACCNLSESFETNPSIDVSFTDAVTGTRKIEMLGLAGPYVQIMRENIPDIRGLSAIHGLTYTPGPWMEGIQLNMGTGSVANGFESITGQINVELRKPENSERLYLNLYANEEGRLEANLNLSHKLTEEVSTGLLLHANKKNNRSDRNNDSFLDMPIGDQLILVNRWKYEGKGKLRMQAGIKATLADQISGQYAFQPKDHEGGSSIWGAELNTNRIEVWTKTGLVFPDKPYKSLGLQLSGLLHEQDAYFGQRNYDAEQRTFYANLMYQSIIGNTNHQFRVGLSYIVDDIDENVAGLDFDRNEQVPGAFAEYTLTPNDQVTLVAGLRGDHHNDYGFFATPRLNFRYALSDRTVIRTAIGRGLRTANIFAENIGMFASSRAFNIDSKNNGNPYGLDAEVAWNFGINLTKAFELFDLESVLSIDLYHTHFENKILVDLENVREVRFYNLAGDSYSTSIQTQLDLSVLYNWDFRLAYRFNDVRSDYLSGNLRKPLSAKHRAFINTAYCTESQLKFDFTLSWQGDKRIPNTSGNPEEFQLDEFSPSFFSANTHISKTWDKLEIYVGAENLFNYRQEDPIISAENPFDEKFDASLIWGPVFGRNVYVGLRYRIK